MVKLTRQQRVAIKRIFDRHPLYVHGMDCDGKLVLLANKTDVRASYKQFRRNVVPQFYGDGAVMLFWANMWLGIEPDGYTHS